MKGHHNTTYWTNTHILTVLDLYLDFNNKISPQLKAQALQRTLLQYQFPHFINFFANVWLEMVLSPSVIKPNKFTHSN
jgi:hypothetical protein